MRRKTTLSRYVYLSVRRSICQSVGSSVMCGYPIVGKMITGKNGPDGGVIQPMAYQEVRQTYKNRSQVGVASVLGPLQPE